MPVQACPARPKSRWSRPPPRPSADPHAQPYRRRRPESTTLHRIVREHLETYLALANEADPMGPMGDGVPDHVEKELRNYLKCGILAHGFARARCASCGYDFLVAFSCKGRGACPSCSAKRMAETAAHLVDHVLPHVPVRQFVLSLPKRLRPYLHHRPRTASAVLHILLRALSATLREACPLAPITASFGAVSFLHRFGSSLNPQFIELSFASFDGLAGVLFRALLAPPLGPLGSTTTSSSWMDSSRKLRVTRLWIRCIRKPASVSTKPRLSPTSSWSVFSTRSE